MRVLFNKVIFQNAENGYCIFRYSVNHDDDLYKRSKHTLYDREVLITATGYYLPTAKSVEFDIEGSWVKDKYGESFAVTSFAPVVPTTEAGLIAFLSSGLIKGIGPKTARAIVQVFGLDTLTVLERSPEDLLAIKGISQKKIDKIITSYQNSRIMRDIISFLAPHNISINKITQIFRAFGNDSLRIIQSNPYRLQEIDGFGFKTVDAIARHINIAPNDTRRIAAAICYALEDCQNSGNLYLEKQEFHKSVERILNEGYTEAAADADEIMAVVKALLTAGEIVEDDDCFYMADCYRAETQAAKEIARLQRGNGYRAVITEEDIENTERALGIKLAEKQKEALVMCLQNNVSIVTGGPGTGKTTTLKAILHLYGSKIAQDVVLMAPTGKAARRMEESTGIPAKTIHSTLNIYSDAASENDDSETDGSFFVVDEFSMVDMFLAQRLFSAIPTGAKVLLVGDPDQLPSIGPGNVFRELITCGALPVTVLNVIYRQAGTSPIVANATKINEGDTSIEFGSDFYLSYASNDISAANSVQKLYLRGVDVFGADNIQILSPYRKRSEAGVDRLNEEIQKIVNPESPRKNDVQYGKRVFRVGDRVMQIKNHEGISNGDVGVIEAINRDDDDEVEVVVSFSGNKVVTYEREDLEMLDLAYATTVHKSQGSEYRVIILVMLQSFHVLLKRNLLYTAVTRAKEKVVIVGHKEAIDTCIRKNDIDKRNTRLGERVCDCM